MVQDVARMRESRGCLFESTAADILEYFADNIGSLKFSLVGNAGIILYTARSQIQNCDNDHAMFLNDVYNDE